MTWIKAQITNANYKLLLTIVFISCCPLLSQAGTPSELKDIRISSPDVNMNYIRSLLFLDVCIETVTAKESAFSLFAFMWVCLSMCVHVSILLCAFFFLFFPRMSDSLSCWVCCMCVCYVLNKDQSINQIAHVQCRQHSRKQLYKNSAWICMYICIFDWNIDIFLLIVGLLFKKKIRQLLSHALL